MDITNYERAIDLNGLFGLSPRGLNNRGSRLDFDYYLHMAWTGLLHLLNYEEIAGWVHHHLSSISSETAGECAVSGSRLTTIYARKAL